jgi:hypothetical protein
MNCSVQILSTQAQPIACAVALATVTPCLPSTTTPAPFAAAGAYTVAVTTACNHKQLSGERPMHHKQRQIACVLRVN